MNALIIAAVLLISGQPQFFPDQPPPKQAVKAPDGIESRKAARDKVLAAVGQQEGLQFTKAFGDLAVEALGACDAEAGKGLVRLFLSGDLARLKNPRAALLAVRNNGTPAAQYLVQHHELLEDPVSLEIWCRTPMEFVFDLKDIELETTRLKESRRLIPSWLALLNSNGNWAYVVMVVLALLLVVVIVRRRKATAQA